MVNRFLPSNLSARHLILGTLILLISLLLGWVLPAEAQRTNRINNQPQIQPLYSQQVLKGLGLRSDLMPLGVAIEREPSKRRADTASLQNVCSKSIDLTSKLRNVSHASAQNNSICTNSDIDVYERDGKTYVVQAGGWDGAWTLTDVSDPAQPVMLHQTIWDRRSYTPDVKAFRQESKDYIVVSMERLNTDGYCGVAIFDVTDPTQPVRTYPADGEDGGGGRLVRCA